MKIAQLYIQDFANFTNFQLDLTYPEGHPKAGQAMDRVCLLGKNGAGKSRVMRVIIDYLRNIVRFKSRSLLMVKLQVEERFIYSVHVNNNVLFFRDTIDEQPEWLIELLRDQAFTMAFNKKYEEYCIGFEEEPELFDSLWFDNNTDNVILYQPSDFYKDRTTKLNDVPLTKGHEAESLKHTFPLYNEISPEHISEFWALLIYLMAMREDQYRDFSTSPEMRVKPDMILKEMFAKQYPEVVPELAKVWAPILDQLDLELDLDSAELPRHIKERLILFLRHKGSGERIDYNALGTGLRRLLFRLGHTWALFFNRSLNNAFCFLEEPEANLHPTFMKGLIGQYEALIEGAQLFVSTHNPSIASEFHPAERLILDRDSDGNISIRRSEAAEDAGTEAILEQDFS